MTHRHDDASGPARGGMHAARRGNEDHTPTQEDRLIAVAREAMGVQRQIDSYRNARDYAIKMRTLDCAMLHARNLEKFEQASITLWEVLRLLGFDEAVRDQIASMEGRKG